MVETLWVYLTNEDRVSVATAFYRINGRLLIPAKVREELPEVDSIGRQDELSDRLGDLLWELEDAIDGPTPTRMVLRFTTADHDLHADFSYQPLQPGVADIELVPDAQLANRWFARLAETGDDSADL